MELTYDWSNFRDTFFPHSPILSGSLENDELNTIKAVVVHSRIAALSGPAETKWIGQEIDAFRSAHQGQPLQVIEAENAEQWVNQSLSQGHAYDQIAEIQEQSGVKFKNHFLLKALESNWAKVFPSTFGILIRLEDAFERDFFILMNKGKLALFHRPELAIMGQARSELLPEVVKYLSEKHSVPVQAISLSEGEWSQLCESPSPWKDLAVWIKSNRAALVPFRWPVLAWVATRAFVK